MNSKYIIETKCIQAGCAPENESQQYFCIYQFATGICNEE